MLFLKQKKGYIALSTVLIISSVVLAISVVITMSAIGAAQGSLAIVKGEDSLNFVEGCVEDGMLKSQASAAYNGGEITRPEGVCQIGLSKSGVLWTMTVSTADPKYQKTILVTFNRIAPKIAILSWKEI